MEQIANTGNMLGSINTASTLNKQTEVSQELTRLNYSVEQLNKLTEELVQRLASVISPRPDNPSKEVQDLNPTVPLATELHTIGNKMLSAEKGLRFILEGLEL